MRLHAISFQSSLFPAHWRPMLRSAVNKQISVSKVGSRLLLPFWCVALATGCLSATFPGPAATPTIASDTGRSIAEIRMLDATSGWAWSNGVEGQYLLLRTTDGGQTWSDVTPRTFPYSEYGGWFLDSQTAWVSTLDRKTYSGGLLRTTDGGKSWSVLVKEGAAPFKCLTAGSRCHFFNTNHGVANTAEFGLGNAYYRYFETHDGGTTWTPVIITSPYPDNDLPPGTIHLCNLCGDGISYYPPTKVIITHGDQGDEQPKGAVRLSLSMNLGKSWRDLRLPVPEKYRDGLAGPLSPVFFDDKNGLLPAHILKRNADHTLAYSALVFYVTDDGGSTWTARPGILEHASSYTQWSFAGQFDVVSLRDVFVRGGPNLYVTSDGARSWRTVKPNIDFGLEGAKSKRDMSRMDFVDTTHGWVVIYDIINDYPYSRYSLYKTSDGGSTWTELALKIVP